MAQHARVRIVSKGDCSRASASRIYLNDEDITHLVKDVKVSIAGEARRWHVELTMIAEVECDLAATTEINLVATSPTE